MAKIRVHTDALAMLLDLPEGAAMFEVEYNDAQKVYTFVVDTPGWPEGPLDLHYETNEHGAVSLTGYTEL